MRRILCFFGWHYLWSNVYGPHECIYTCHGCGKRRWIEDEESVS